MRNPVTKLADAPFQWRSAIRAALGFIAALATSISAQPASEVVPIDGDDIGGVVTGPNGPEAGVWVIAETDDLPTKFRKIVVTDDRGRYLLPDFAGRELRAPARTATASRPAC
jgi:hypothetical protein